MVTDPHFFTEVPTKMGFRGLKMASSILHHIDKKIKINRLDTTSYRQKIKINRIHDNTSDRQKWVEHAAECSAEFPTIEAKET
jgi:hypothetical protein